MRLVEPVVLVLILLALVPLSGTARGHDAGASATPTFEIGSVGVVGGAVRLQLSNRTIAWEGPTVSDDIWPRAYPILFHDITRHETRDTGYRGSMICYQYPMIVLWQAESWHGDLNGDGDRHDGAYVAYDVTSAESWTLAYGLRSLSPWSCASAGRVAYGRSETDAQVDFNADGDTRDTIGFVHNLANGTETSLGPAYEGLLAGRYVAWLCPNDSPADLCYWDFLGTRRGRIPLSTLYPGAYPRIVGADRDHIVLILWEGTEAWSPHLDIDGNGRLDEAWPAVLTLSTGEMRLELTVGNVSPYSGFRVSESQALFPHGYGYPWPEGSSGSFVYDLETRATSELDFGYIWNVQFHPGVILSNNHGGECTCDPGQHPPPPPNVRLHDIRTGETYDTGVDGYLMYSPTVFDGDTFALSSTEMSAGEDVNGDGDRSDPVVIHVTIRRPGEMPSVDGSDPDTSDEAGAETVTGPATGPGPPSTSAIEGLQVVPISLLGLAALQIVLPALWMRRMRRRYP